jgi:periplasmic protein TonB
MSYANRKQMSSNRTAAIVIVALIHIALGYALVTGLAYNVIKNAADKMKTFDVEEEPPPPPEEPPPPPDTETPPPPQIVAPPPIVRTNTVAPPIISTPVAPPPVITPTARPAPPAPPAPPKPVISQAAKAKANLPSLFSTDDYPPSALRNEEQGTTAVRITVGTDGRVADCSVTSSSGSSTLDAATCSIIKRRARYTPAKDQSGNPITGNDSARIRWVLPAD